MTDAWKKMLLECALEELETNHAAEKADLRQAHDAKQSAQKAQQSISNEGLATYSRLHQTLLDEAQTREAKALDRKQTDRVSLEHVAEGEDWRVLRQERDETGSSGATFARARGRLTDQHKVQSKAGVRRDDAAREALGHKHQQQHAAQGELASKEARIVHDSQRTKRESLVQRCDAAIKSLDANYIGNVRGAISAPNAEEYVKEASHRAP
ncbi:hypothetical protein SPRG_12075 [Saprolegnia parasitica CBS 223.65]|uniref:Uncharacterized protein n=1 Tax=Saprolegnia parasitica (strain CBS 223.65) TaxID=695850 RepID=A0A067BU87_SAPPC|nr:hypothetical protein SPRG_12075 [Saprolegnia parasitica CBS 223.65]KDO22089.1 hypothetical protein SPRG_12075 [Saprolegnia parasitica CBS 223.65]|eukprot:XP_012207231.1 hypothetical protein SPRG_12075 [Saprolegnia parasitica CBS 223.65]